MLRKIGELWVRNDRPVRVTPVTESGEESGAGRMAGRRVTRFRRLSRLRRRRPHCDRLALKFAAMPVPTHVQHEKNIWVAAGDGDLERVRELVENQSLSPNVPDAYTYTPMHAAASYGHLHILEYLISKGGDVNITDDDGDTPLYVVENVETARFLVDHGAVVDRHNSEGVSPAEHLAEDFQEVAAFLEGVSPSRTADSTSSPSISSPSQHQPSHHAQEMASESLTSSLMQSVQDVMQRAEAEGRDPDEELRQVVGRTVLQGMVTGYGMSTEAEDSRDDRDDSSGAKRSRMDDGPG